MKKNIFSVIGIIVLSMALMSVYAWAVPDLINYQGKLTDFEGTLLDENYTMIFSIYNSETEGTDLWTEEQTVSITEGIYNVQLGANVPLPEDLFHEDLLYLEVSIKDPNTDAIETLSPRLQFTSSAYAMKAKDVEGGDVRAESLIVGENKLVVKDDGNVGIGTINPEEKLDVFGGNLSITRHGSPTLILNSTYPGATMYSLQTGRFSNKDFVIHSTHGGDHIYINDIGNVGIDTTSPTEKLHIANGAIRAGKIVLDFNDVIMRSKNVGNLAMWASSAWDEGALFKMEAEETSSDAFGFYWNGERKVVIKSSGNVGIGTTSPSALLDVNGKIISDDLSTKSLKTIIDTYSYSTHRKIRLNWSGGSTANGYVGTYLITMGGRGDHHQTAFATGILIINKAYTRVPEIRFRVLSGYGVYMEEETVTDTQLVLDFHINLSEHTKSHYSVLKVSGSVGLSMDDSWSVQVEDDSDYTNGIGATMSEGVFMNGNVGIGTIDPSEKLEVKGTTKTVGLEITGGADISEQFKVKSTTESMDEEYNDEIEPGMVVSIDPENPGQLVICKEKHDRKVAGVISGAGGLKPGLLMGQEGSVAYGSYPVALTGRVYCLADASQGQIQPGDLLTTSDIPGHAMKVSNYDIVNGAILGKAMSTLKKGQGLVLVLLSLQ